MPRPHLLDALRDNVLLADGGTGTHIQALPLEIERDFHGKENCSEVLNLSRPDLVRDMHRGYGGFVLRAGKHSIYHAGDTAYFEGFREIGQRLKPEVALLPIGAYHPDSFRRVHTSPEDAVQAFLDLGARWTCR